MFIRSVPEFVSNIVNNSQNLAYNPPNELVINTVDMLTLQEQCTANGIKAYVIGFHAESHGLVLEIKSLEECRIALASEGLIPMTNPTMLVHVNSNVFNVDLDITLIHGNERHVSTCSFADNPIFNAVDNLKEFTGYMYSTIHQYEEYMRKLKRTLTRADKQPLADRANGQFFMKNW